jgi:hypothetical protein
MKINIKMAFAAFQKSRDTEGVSLIGTMIMTVLAHMKIPYMIAVIIGKMDTSLTFRYNQKNNIR